MFRKRQSFILLTVLIFTLFFASSCSSKGGSPPTNTAPTEGNASIESTEENSAANEPIDFEDPILFNLLKKELGKDEICPEDLASYTSIKIAADKFVFLASSGDDEKRIVHFFEDAFEYDGVRYEGFGTMKSLADLKYFTSLDKIYITLQPEIDYSTIPEEIAKKVRSVHIYQSQLEDISFLKDFESLMVLTLNTNNIEDLSPLEGKDTILWLRFDGNDVHDLTPLSSLTALKSVSAHSNKIVDLTPLSGMPALEKIEFYNNLIKDISPLKEIRSLKSVELINNRIEDVSPLQEFKAFDELRLTGNPITNIETLSHITNLEF